MSPNNAFPIKTKKPRSISAQNNPPPQNTDLRMPEFINEFASIEKELNYHKIGTFKVYYRDMNFSWKDGQNRSIASEAQSAALKESMQNGIFRTDLNHRMSGIMARQDLQGQILSPGASRQCDDNLDIEKIAEYNKNAEYPVIFLSYKDSATKIEMQSGQHRMTILRQLKTHMSEHWWIVTIYDDRMFK